jgi:hypothetical protein
MTAQVREHSIQTIVQDPRIGAEGTVRVTCTCGELCEESPCYGTGLDYLVSEELHHQGLTSLPLPAQARGTGTCSTIWPALTKRENMTH